MLAFISHSFENKPEFDNIVDGLVHEAVPYWDPAEVKAGGSLRDQLRAAVEQCGVCIFIATRKAVDSSWCGAELGAFWGTGKPIIVYLAEPSLTDDDLPPIVQGDVWERRITRVAKSAKQILDRGPANPGGGKAAQPSQVGNMTVEQLQTLIAGAVALAAATGKPQGQSPAFDEIRDAARGAAGLMLEGVRAAEGNAGKSIDDWSRQILWVDDRPENNVYVRQAFESMGFRFSLALSTAEAERLLASNRFAAIISDMGRKEGPKEGYVLLDSVRQTDTETPFFIFAGSSSPQHKRETAAKGAQGTTNDASELVDMILQTLPRRDSR